MLYLILNQKNRIKYYCVYFCFTYNIFHFVEILYIENAKYGSSTVELLKICLYNYFDLIEVDWITIECCKNI